MEAYYLFTEEGRYEDAILLLQELKASPLDVIDLFGDLGGGDEEIVSGTTVYYRQINFYFIDPVALNALTHYLTTQRTLLSKILTQYTQLRPDQQYTLEHKETLSLARIVDTTLLKAYVKVNDALAGSLLRVGNHVDLEEGEKLLLKEKVLKQLLF